MISQRSEGSMRICDLSELRDVRTIGSGYAAIPVIVDSSADSLVHLDPVTKCGICK